MRGQETRAWRREDLDKTYRNVLVVALAAALVAMTAPPVSADGPEVPEPWFQAPDPLVVAGSGFRQHLALVTIPSQGAQPIVNLPVPETLHFNLAIQLPYQNGTAPGDDPSAVVSTVNEVGQAKQYAGYVNRHEDPSSNATGSTIELFFNDVDYVRTSPYTLTMSWEPGAAYAFKPTDLTGFQLEITEYGVVAYSLADAVICDSPIGCPESPLSSSSASTGSNGGSANTNSANTKASSSTSGSGQTKTQANTGGSTGGGGSGGSGGCTGRTYVGHSVQNTAGFADTNPNQGNVWKTFASADFDAPTTWYGGCNRAGPGSYWAGNGYGATVRGPNNPAIGGSYLIDWSTAYKGGGEGYGSNDGFGYKSITAKPQLAFGKPSQNKIKLESTSVLGLNKNSCTSWPQPVKDALDVLSFFVQNSYASVVLYFATKDYCSNDKPWTSLDSGTSNDRSQLGARLDKGSVNAQYEYGGRFAFKAVTTGTFTMPFTYQENVYGTVTAHGNPSASFNYWTPGLTTGQQPSAKVV